VSQLPTSQSPFVRHIRLYDEADPLVLRSGARLAPVDVAYETYGELDAGKANAVVVCHALTGDAHVALHHPGDRAGWWDTVVGPGRPVDTDRFHVVCANLLGGCSGTTGPASTGPDGRPYALRFPDVHVADMLAVQRRLVRALGIERLYGVIGGSVGGMLALEWLLAAPEEAQTFVIVAAPARLSTDNLAWNAVARAAILADPGFRDGDYYGTAGPRDGLGIARMIGHLSYLCEQSLSRKFGRSEMPNAGHGHPALRSGLAIESYLQHQARKLVDRFDANSYLYLLRAMDSYDAFADHTSLLPDATRPEVLLVSFANDRLFGREHIEYIAGHLAARGLVPEHYHEDSSTIGHDAFLLDVPGYLDRLALHFAARPPVAAGRPVPSD
jgi:homoserine O-acetyltransferase